MIVSAAIRAACLRITVALGALLVIVIGAIGILQERFVFVPPAVPAMQGRGVAKIEYEAKDGQRLFGFLARPDTDDIAATPSGAGAVLVFHGNGDLADSWVDWARETSRMLGIPVFIAEYRGYGGLTGRPSYRGVVADANAALDAVTKSLAVGSERVVLYGHSLGTGLATELATRRPVRALLLEAPITSLDDMGQRTFGPPISWALPLVSRSPFAPLDQVRSIDVPVWVAVAGLDEVIPADMGRAVFAAASRKGELLEVPNATHGNISDRGGARYQEWLRKAVVGSP